jgi:hypothetical protein
MATWPVVTGDIVTSTIWNGLPVYELATKAGTTYTLASGDQYQQLLVFTSSSAKTVSIPTDATYDFPDGTAITILNNNAAGTLTIQAVNAGTTVISSAGASSVAPTVGAFKAAIAIKTGTNAWTVCGAIA